MMKKYIPEEMVKISRYQNYFPSLEALAQKDIYARMNELLEEEKQYCDKGNYEHMSQILTSIAMYEILQKHGKTEEEAYRIVSEEMWKFLDPTGMQKLARKSFFMSLMKKVVPFLCKDIRQTKSDEAWCDVLPCGHHQLRRTAVYRLHPNKNTLSGR